MIVTITLNPCIDKTMYLETFQYGGLNRVMHSRQDISGKGINVAKAAKQLGMDVMCLGFNYSDNKALLEEELHKLGIAFHFVELPGRLRTNVKIFEKESGTMTELNEKGEYASGQTVDELLQVVENTDGDIFVLSGSVPPGVDSDIYKRIIQRLNGKSVILDAERDYLRLGMEACPTVIKPNLFELESAFGVKLSSHLEIVEQCRRIIDGGVEVVCVSMGKDGAIITDKDSAYYAPVLPIEVRAAQGAGDSLVAGICRALQERIPAREMLRYAVAAAGGSLIREGTLMCTAEGFEEMYQLVEIKKI